MILDGAALADETKREVAGQAEAFRDAHGRKPGLAVILVGDDPASEIYVARKRKAALGAGIESFEHRLPAQTSQNAIIDLVKKLNTNDAIDGILVQLPLPGHISGLDVIEAIDPSKDVDGFHPYNAGRLAQRDPALVPCTPLGIIRMLKNHLGDSLHGLHAVVIGASMVVGRPVAQLLLIEGCTVTVTHRFTRDTPSLTRLADIVIAAAGKPGLVTADWVKPGATVIDVGINRVDGNIVGDVDYADVQSIAGAITPVPGGVGPMTIAMLLRNTVEAAVRRLRNNDG